MKKNRIILFTAILLVIASLAYWFYTKKETRSVVKFETAQVQTGSISNTVTATGTVQPVKQVEVGTQVSGVIQKIYVDYNSKVTKGQLLAELDKTPLLAQLASSRADLDAASSQLNFQLSNYNRIKLLYEKKSVSETDFENALYLYNNAKANADKMKSELDRAQTNLSYALIYSPISGVVLSRAVDEGQTVAASFNTPTLFTIAQDLTKMQVVANVDEADIGQVQNGQKVTFTVDAFPEEIFNGSVTQVRLKPTTNANVVTYSVVIDAPNPDLKLKPGLTASIIDYSRQAEKVLVIPAKALRFEPDSASLAEYYPNPGKTDFTGKPAEVKPSPVGKANQKGTPKPQGGESSDRKKVWVKSGDSIRPVEVTTGLTDETNVEIKTGLSLGDEVILSMERTTAITAVPVSNASSSPFMPKRPSRK